MLRDSKDMPKIQTITDAQSIEKYGGNRMYFAQPIDYEEVMKKDMSLFKKGVKISDTLLRIIKMLFLSYKDFLAKPV